MPIDGSTLGASSALKGAGGLCRRGAGRDDHRTQGGVPTGSDPPMGRVYSSPGGTKMGLLFDVKCAGADY